MNNLLVEFYMSCSMNPKHSTLFLLGDAFMFPNLVCLSLVEVNHFTYSFVACVLNNVFQETSDLSHASTSNNDSIDFEVFQDFSRVYYITIKQLPR